MGGLELGLGLGDTFRVRVSITYSNPNPEPTPSPNPSLLQALWVGAWVPYWMRLFLMPLLYGPALLLLSLPHRRAVARER